MRRGLLACSIIAVLAAPAGAAGYDDFTRGLTAKLRGDAATAITAFTAALAAPDLVPAYRPAAYRSRATAYLELDRCDEAMADITSYVALKGNDTGISWLRMWVHLCRKEAAAARQDYEGLTHATTDADSLWLFSRLEWRYGLFSEAAAIAEQAYVSSDKSQPLAPYILLWQALNATRAGHFDQAAFAAALAQWKERDWPRPILEFYNGKRSAENVLKEASSWHESKDAAQRCEGNFYIAEWHLAHNDTASATPLLLAVSSSCPTDFIEYSSALAELKRMGVPVPKE